MAGEVVVDTSMAFKWLVDEDDSALADAYHRSWRAADIRIVVPCWFACELGNVLLQRVHGGRLTSIQSTQLLGFALAWVTVLDPDPEIAIRAIQIASQLRQRASYDAQYVALAERLGCELWTADRRFALAAQPDFPFVRWLGQPV